MNFYNVILIVFVIVLFGCKNEVAPQEGKSDDLKCKQESSKAIDWVASWKTCEGDGAVKSDGTLWQFGKVGMCNWGQIMPIDFKTGKPIYKKKIVYHLQPRKIGEGFGGAKIINGSYRVYAIKKDGTLWGWGKGFRKNPMLLSRSYDWVDFSVKYEGNGCCAHDIGLQKDGTLWRFPEFFDFSKRSPMGKLKRIGTKKWDKVLLYCCAIYARSRDGNIWINKGLDAHIKFKKFNQKRDCQTGDIDFCKKLEYYFESMASLSINHYDVPENEKIDVGIQTGRLCVFPEIRYE